MLSPADSVGEGIILPGCPSAEFVRSFRQIYLPRYLMNGLSNVNETYRAYSLVPTEDLVRF